MSIDTDWKYADALQDHRWVEQHRLPVVGSPYPRWRYHVAVMGYSELWDTIEPTDAEAAQLGSYLQFWLQKFYSPSYIELMRERPFDIDAYTVTLTFLKREGGTWHYKQCTWEHGPWPFPNAERQYHDLVDLLDHVENLIPEKWAAWKAEHPDIFPPKENDPHG